MNGPQTDRAHERPPVHLHCRCCSLRQSRLARCRRVAENLSVAVLWSASAVVVVLLALLLVKVALRWL